MMLALYQLLTLLISPLLPYYLARRERRGKEQKERMPERFGHATAPRPHGRLVWIHAASVGEANSVLPLIYALHEAQPQLHLLLTTGTVTSASLMRQRLPSGVIHQYIPLDTPQATRRFFRHWQPECGLMVESELWPNLLLAARASGCRLMLINGRMSARSQTKWQRMPQTIRTLLAAFSRIFAQSEADAARYLALGAAQVEYVGNLKHDAQALGVNTEALAEMERALEGRPRWLAASVHPGEVEAIAEAHRLLRIRMPTLVTLIVPRHPEKGVAFREALEAKGLRVALRSANETVQAETEIYLADTLGELGLFYRLSPVAFIGGSLIAHGGQNPLEGARLGTALCFGPHIFNFADVAQGLLAADAGAQVKTPLELAEFVATMMKDDAARAAKTSRASTYVAGEAGANACVLQYVLNLLAEEKQHAA